MTENEALKVKVTLIPQLGDPVNIKVKDISDPVLKAELLHILMSNKMKIGKIVKRI